MPTTTAEPEPHMTTKASLTKRALAYLLDALLAGLVGAGIGMLSSTFGGLAAGGYMLLRDGLNLDLLDRRSWGKHVMKLRPLRLDGRPMDLDTSIRRNWVFAIGCLASGTFIFGLGKFLSILGTALVIYEIYKVYTDPRGQRWGDEMAGTQVVEVED